MKKFLKALLWIVGAAALVLLVLFVGALFERQAELADLSEEDKAELRQKLADGELEGDGVMQDAWEDVGAKTFLADILERVKDPRVLRYGGIALGVVVLLWLVVQGNRYRRTLADRKRKKEDEAQLDQALDRIEQDIKAGPGAKKRKAAAADPPAEKKPPFWSRWIKKKKPAVTSDDADLMPWEIAADEEAPDSGGGAPAPSATPSMELESYSARGKPSKQIDRPAEKMLAAGTSMELDQAPASGGKTPDPQPAASSSGDLAGTSMELPPASAGGFRPKDMEAARKLLTKHMNRCIGSADVGVSSSRTGDLVAVAVGAVRSHPNLDDARRAHLPIEVRLAIRLAEEVGRQCRPGEEGELAKAMVDVVLGLQEEG